MLGNFIAESVSLSGETFTGVITNNDEIFLESYNYKTRTLSESSILKQFSFSNESLFLGDLNFYLFSIFLLTSFITLFYLGNEINGYMKQLKKKEFQARIQSKENSRKTVVKDTPTLLRRS